jgi:hypothetical protein
MKKKVALTSLLLKLERFKTTMNVKLQDQELISLRLEALRFAQGDVEKAKDILSFIIAENDTVSSVLTAIPRVVVGGGKQ